MLTYVRNVDPKKIKNSEKILTFWQIFEVRCFRQSSNLTSVETKPRHDVTVKQGVFQLMKKETQLTPSHFVI
jgi:hypothetical protein